MRYRALWTGSLCLPALAGALLSGAALAGEPEMRGTPSELRQYLKPQPRQVVLQGHARVTVQSDVGHASVAVHTTGKDLASALRANAARREAFVAALLQAGLAAKDIRAEKFSTSPQYGWFGKTPASYDVTNKLTVAITDDRQLQAVAEAAGQSTETQFGGATFELAKEQDVLESVRHQAFDDALARRRYFEDRMGATLRPVAFQFYDGSGRAPQPVEEVAVFARAGVAGAADMAAPPPVPTFDERVFEVTVDVTFEVGPPPGQQGASPAAPSPAPPTAQPR